MSEDHDGKEVAWFWAIVIGLYLLGTAIYNLGWQIVTATFIGVPLIVWACVAVVGIYLASEFHRVRKFNRQLKRRIRRGIKQIRRL